jgi:hypothetical protein
VRPHRFASSRTFFRITRFILNDVMTVFSGSGLSLLPKIGNARANPPPHREHDAIADAACKRKSEATPLIAFQPLIFSF